MCKIMEDMRNEATEKATENTLLQTIRNLMETLKLTSDEAMAAMKIPDADREKYLSRL